MRWSLRFLLLILLLGGIESVTAADLSQSLNNIDRPAGVSDSPGLLRLGPMAVHPYLILKEAYSDNIYSVTDGKDSDFITSVTPGVYLELPVKAHTLSLNANMTSNSYSKFSDENTTDYFISGNGNFILGNLLNVKLSDAYTKGHEPRSASSTAEIEKFTNNLAAVSLTYLVAQVSKVQIDYSRTNWNFRTSEFRSRDEDMVSAFIYYRLMPKTSAFVEYDFKDVSFKDKTNGLDNKVNSGLVGLIWEATARSRATIKGGYLTKDFDLSTQGSLSTWTASADINYDFSDRTTFRLIGKRDVNESAILGTRYYISTGLYSELTHKFLDRLAGAVRASYGVDKYADIISGDTVLRRDEALTTGVGAHYFMRRWLELVLDYNHRHKSSNISTYNNTENTVTFTLNAAF